MMMRMSSSVKRRWATLLQNWYLLWDMTIFMVRRRLVPRIPKALNISYDQGSKF